MNKFFTTDDKKVTHVGKFKLPRVWWSRPYEYFWAMEFVKEGETVLDVGCGMEHPFKHYLGSICKKTVALDTNKLVTEIKDENVEFVHGDILDFEYKEKFDKIFIISTLEQTKERLDEKLVNIKKLLKNYGLVVITSDYPSVNCKELIEKAEKAGLVVEGEFNNEIPENAIKNNMYGITVYSLVLKHKAETKKTTVQKVEDRKTKVDKPKLTKKR